MKEKDIKNFIDDLKKTSHLELKIKGCRDNAPRPLRYYNSKKLFVPDVEVNYKNKRDFYVFEALINKDDIALLTFKWILFAAEARKLNGEFHLVVDNSNYIFCKKVVFDKQLELVLIKI